MPTALDFYFDFASPYGYLAATQIDKIAARHARTVRWHPILLGAALKATGMRPLAEIPLRGDYMHRDAPRFARYLGVPFAVPPGFPIAALAASRAVVWLDDGDPVAAKALARALYDAHWGRGEDIRDAAQVAAIAAPLGVDAESLVAAVQSQEVKDRLRARVEASLAAGVFGSPFVIVEGESFWGADRLDQLDWWLSGGR